MSMDKNVKVKWIAALRSGQYKQTQGRLKDGYGYCCLGLLCHVMEPSNMEEDENQIRMRDGKYGIRRGTLGKINKDTWGISDDEEEKLIGMNDRQGRSFSEIADYVEKL